MKAQFQEKTRELFGTQDDFELEPNKRFKHFKETFANLTKSKNVITMYPIVTCIITYNSKSVLTVTRKSDREYYIKQYSLESYELTMAEMIGGEPDSYIKAKDVVQNSDGD